MTKSNFYQQLLPHELLLSIEEEENSKYRVLFLSKEFLESVETFFLSFLSLLGSSFDLCIRNVNFFLDLLYSLYHKNIGQSTFCSGLSILYTKTNH